MVATHNKYIFSWMETPQIRADNFMKSKHVQVIVAVSLSETLIYDFVLVAVSPCPFSQLCQTTDKMKVFSKLGRLWVKVLSYVSFLDVIKVFF